MEALFSYFFIYFYIFFYLSNLFLSLDVKCVSYRQHIVKSCFIFFLNPVYQFLSFNWIMYSIYIFNNYLEKNSLLPALCYLFSTWLTSFLFLNSSIISCLRFKDSWNYGHRFLMNSRKSYDF